MGGRKIRVGVSGHDLKFWYPLQRALEQTGRYEFREDVWTGHDTHDAPASQALLDWADVLVAEWALGNAVWYSRRKRPHQRLLVRLHAQERRTRYPEDIDYSAVERVVFVGPHLMAECIEKFGIPPDLCVVVGNLVDTERFALSKFGGSERVLGIVGTAPALKRLDLAVDTLEVLLKRDDRYSLRVKGQNPASIPWLWARTAERQYYEQLYARINSGPLRHRVIFDPKGNDVHQWLRMVGVILSPSEAESFHMALAEGAASAAWPVAWAWHGSAEVYPEFEFVASAEEAADRIEFLNASASGPRLREQAKAIVRHRYDTVLIAGRWGEMLDAPLPGKNPSRREQRPVLVVWAIDNWSTFHRKEMLEALAANLAGECNVLVIEPGSHLETIGKLGWASGADLARIAGGELLPEGGNLYRTRLLTGGIPAGIPKAHYQGAASPLEILDGLVAAHFGAKSEVVHWVYKPDQASRLGTSRRFIYEVYDDYTLGFATGAPDPKVTLVEREILPLAEHVFFTSRPLQERKAGFAKASSLIGNGVNYDAFARFRPARKQREGRPVAGYLGNLSDFFDWRLMQEICSSMPDIDFVFHGQVEAERLGDRIACYQEMRGYANVRFTGRVTRPSGAAAVARYDVLLIPFVVNDAMHAVNPLKLWEYFATGLPVVSSRMKAVEESPSLLRIADDAEAWVQAIKESLVEVDPASADARIARAETHRWENLTRGHAEVVRDVLGSRLPAATAAAKREAARS